ncbi:MAG: serine hydrolase [Gammaproteobacteria bacterium]|nr:serine hydrolase [Gammaproteobacteria bacterium]
MPLNGHFDPRFEPVAQAFLEGFEQGRDVGASLAVVIDGTTVIDVWHGHTDRRREQPWQQDTLVCMFSVTKAMTAVCLLQAVDRGLVDLDAPVAGYWPEFAGQDKDAITLRQCMSHRAGLVGFHHPVPRETLYDWEGYVAALADEHPWWTPDIRHGYHAQTYGFLLGEVLRRCTGRGIGEWFRAEIAEPLDLDFAIGLPESDLERCAEMLPAKMRAGEDRHLPPGARDMMRDFNDPSTPTGAAFQSPAMGPGYRNAREFRTAEIPASNGHGTARSAARMYDRLGTLISRETLEQAITTHSQGADEVLKSNTHFGLGFMLQDEAFPCGSGRVRAKLGYASFARAAANSPIGARPGGPFGHAGAGGSMAFHDPEAKLSFCFAMNQMEMGVITGGTSASRTAAAVYDCL